MMDWQMKYTIILMGFKDLAEPWLEIMKVDHKI
jgi:hypothetical protein